MPISIFQKGLLQRSKEILDNGLLKRSIGKETVCSHQRRIQIFLNIGRMKEMPQIIGGKGRYREYVMEIKEKV